jgi:hypothetical protein
MMPKIALTTDQSRTLVAHDLRTLANEIEQGTYRNVEMSVQKLRDEHTGDRFTVHRVIVQR